MRYFLSIMLMLALFSCSQDTTSTTITEVKSRQDSISYSIGADIGANLRQQYVDIKPAVLYKGFTDGYQDEELMIPMEEMQKLMISYRKELLAEQDRINRELGATNLVEAEKFLEENSKKDNIIVTPSGLQYEVLETGDGPLPKSNNRVKVHYRGTLLDGTEFDSSHKRGEPATFAVTGVIKGWTEALQLMPVGSKWKLYVHPNLAYGNRNSRTIPSNSALIFEVELLEIVE